MSWKKRGKSGWVGKKEAKQNSKGREREYGKQDIKQQLQEDFEGDEFRYRGGKKKRNEIGRLEYWRDLYQRYADEGRKTWWGSDYATRAKHCQKEIDELKKKKL